jgi:hypothetical protein
MQQIFYNFDKSEVFLLPQAALMFLSRLKNIPTPFPPQAPGCPGFSRAIN